MAHGDRLSNKDITMNFPPSPITTQRPNPTHAQAWDINTFAVTGTELITINPFWALLMKSLKSTRAYSSSTFSSPVSDGYFYGCVSGINNDILIASGTSFYQIFSVNLSSGNWPGSRQGGDVSMPTIRDLAQGALARDGNNLYVADSRSAQNLIKVYNLTNSSRVNSLEFSAAQLSGAITVANINSIVIRNDLITFFNTAGRGFSFNKTTKARMATMDLNLGFSRPSYAWEAGLEQFIAQNPGDAEFYAIHSATTTRLVFRAYEYNPDPAVTALGEIARQSGGAATKKTYTHILRGGHTAAQKIYRGSDEIWTPGAVPAITSFTAAPTSVDLDTRATGNITLTFAATDSTNNRITNQRTGANVPLTTSTTAVVAQPLEPTTYVLTCRNEHGSTHQAVTVDVNRNPQVNNLRRTGFRQSLHGTDSGTYRFGATIIGLPQPTLRYSFSVGGSGEISARHLTQGARPDTWTLDWTHYFGTNVPRRLTITATNASGSASASVANIQAG